MPACENSALGGADSVSNSGKVNQAVSEAKFDRLQISASAGPGNAFAVFNGEHGAVGRADNIFPVSVQEAIRHPIQFESGMGTAVSIKVKLVVFADCEY